MNAPMIQSLFTRPDGTFLCARWGRPIVPVVFGVDDATLATVKGAIEAVVFLAHHRMAETDPELGANLMVFFLRDWAELTEIPDLDGLVPGMTARCARLAGKGANQYRSFRFDADGAIKAAFVFLRMDEHLSAMPAEDLALVQAAQSLLTWGEGAFQTLAPLSRTAEGATVLNPDLAVLLRTAYTPILPAAAQDPSHALRLGARFDLAKAQLEAAAENPPTGEAN